MINQGQTGRAGDFISEFTLGETISAAGTPLCLAETAADAISNTVINNNSSNAGRGVSPTGWDAQSFVVPAGVTKLHEIYLVFRGFTNPNGIRVRIRSTLTGTDLWQGEWQTTPTSDWHGETWSNIGLAVTPGNTYYVVIEGLVNGQEISVLSTTTPYGTYWGSGNSGVSWSAQANVQLNMILKFVEYTFIAKRVYKASAGQIDQRLNFIGFALETGTAGQRKKVATHTIYSGLSGLVTDQDYYLSNTSGALSTTPGNIHRWVGRAKNATTLDRMLGIRRVVSPPISMSTNVNIIPAYCEIVRWGTSGLSGTTLDGIELGPSGVEHVNVLARAGASYGSGSHGGNNGNYIILLQ
jgi:hypothetical protein